MDDIEYLMFRCRNCQEIVGCKSPTGLTICHKDCPNDYEICLIRKSADDFAVVHAPLNLRCEFCFEKANAEKIVERYNRRIIEHLKKI